MRRLISALLSAASRQKPAEEPPADSPRARPKERFEEAVGAILLYLGAHPRYEHMLLDDVRQRIIPAVRLRQYRTVETPDGDMIAYVSWARLDAGAVERLTSSSPSDGFVLSEEEWDGGDEVVIIDVAVTVPGEEEKVCRKVKREVFDGERTRTLRFNAENGAIELVDVE